MSKLQKEREHLSQEKEVEKLVRKDEGKKENLIPHQVFG